MKKLNLLITIPIILLLSGCSHEWKIGKCTQWGVCKTVKDSTHIIDSTYLVAVPYDVNPDTAWLDAWMECDDSMRVILTHYEQTNGKYIRLWHDVQSGKYTVISYIKGRTDTIYRPGSVRYEYRDKVQQIEVNKLTWWQRTMIIVGYVGLGLFVLILIYIAYKIYRKIKPG